MKAMVLQKTSNLVETWSPLQLVHLPLPVPKEKEVLIRVSACGVCHTELDEIEGRTPPSIFPIIPGHQVVGRVEAAGSAAMRFRIGDRVGVGWIYSACGRCRFCREGKENLCDDFKATGRDAHGGYAEYMTVSEDFAFLIPEAFSDAEAAPLLCAGAIGYRSLRLTDINDGENVGLTGFGASAHLVLKMIGHLYPGSKCFVFSRTERERSFANELGAFWEGDIEEPSPEKLHAIIDTTPAWLPVVKALGNLEQGGRLVINAIRKEEKDKRSLLDLDYARDLWKEKEIKSVANITRRDVEEFLKLAAEIPVRPEIEEFGLEDANDALMELKERNIRGAKVLRVS
ncbi:MAG TPA: zinc-dependent alcohol dehydrogenase family protein [Thermodesulfovibrionales bacterium]|nr:zinc-dependent alcohol dehydrogenase family protein [Thermodesulfovibrionales bacterium]